MKTLAILVSGGPAPVINAVIAAATIEARNHKIRVRLVNVQSQGYQTLYEYMIRLKPEEFLDPKMVRRLARAGQLSVPGLIARFGSLVRGVDANREKQGTR